jgi:hypothetical protein
MRWRFAGKFLLTFAFLLVLWWAVDLANLYRLAVLATARQLSPIVNGWWLDYGRPGEIAEATFRSSDRELKMLLQLPALSMGLMPFIALVVATPGIRLKRAAFVAALGSLLYFLLHVTVVLTYPLIMDRPNVLKDTAGVFSGLVAFVVAPLGLWFVLTYPELRALWQLTPVVKPASPSQASTSAPAPTSLRRRSARRR